MRRTKVLLDLTDLLETYTFSILSQNKSKKTVQIYVHAINRLIEYLTDNGLPTSMNSIKASYIEGFISHTLSSTNPRNGLTIKPATAHNFYRSLRTFFQWCVEEGEIEVSPMARTKAPILPEEPTVMLSEDEVRRILKACEGSDFYARRDAAIIRLLLSCGLRRAELTNLMLDDLDWSLSLLYVLGKGRRPRSVPFGHKAGLALRQYLRVRATYPSAKLPNLWLGRHGAMTGFGIYQIVAERAAQAGLKTKPHALRHLFAHSWLSAGGNESDLMRICGWKSRSMLQRYGASLADERAREAYSRLAVGDRY